MIDFFTKTLSGTTYIIALIICIILILALIGVMSEIKYVEIKDEPSKQNEGQNQINNNLPQQNNTPVQTVENNAAQAPPMSNNTVLNNEQVLK